MLEFYDDGCGCRPTVKITDTGSMSTYQKLCYVLQLIEEIVEFVNNFQAELDKKEDSDNITNNRKLSENGCFTGSLGSQCESVESVLNHIDENSVLINDNQETIAAVAQRLDDKVSLEFIIDGGVYPFTDPAVYEIDGGVL